MAWTRKLLRVNLTAGTCTAEPLNMEWAQQYLGQRGLGSKYLAAEIDPKVDPLAPGNKLIFATGPLTGTMASTGGRYSVITKGALTGVIACSNSGGYFGAELKFAGWDMIIFEGKAAKPVYLSIVDDVAELRDAAHLWGKTVWETEEIIKMSHQDPQLRVSGIGRAGENQVRFAAVINDLHRAAGRSGVGAVMGSKNLKAVAVRGTQSTPAALADPDGFFKSVNAAKKLIATNPITGQAMPMFGTMLGMTLFNEAGAHPTRNHRDVQFENIAAISGEALQGRHPTDSKPYRLRNTACFACTLACGQALKIDPNHFSIKDKPRYQASIGGPEYEAGWALGSDLGVSDLDALIYANTVCNEDGMDPISFGVTVAAAMELYELGILTKEETGVEMPFGSAEALVKLVEWTASGEGFGKVIGMGSLRMCTKYGKPELSMTVKGQEFPAYDPRALQGMGLAYATSNRGACHLRGYTVNSEVFGSPVKTDPKATEEKAPMLKVFQDTQAVIDSTGLCSFSASALALPDFQPQIQAACEGDWSMEKLLLMGERIWNLEREFNLAAGMTAKDDNLPPRMLNEPCRSGPQMGMVSHLDKMLPEYYQVRGWTKKGVPTPETRARLGL